MASSVQASDILFYLVFEMFLLKENMWEVASFTPSRKMSSFFFLFEVKFMEHLRNPVTVQTPHMAKKKKNKNKKTVMRMMIFVEIL